MSESLIMIVGPEASIAQLDLLQGGLSLLSSELTQYGYRMGQVEVLDPELVRAPLSPSGTVTGIFSKSENPFVMFEFAGIGFDPGRLLRTVGSHFARTYGVNADVS